MLIAFFYWLTKCSLYRPVILKNPGVYGLVVNFCGFAKFAKRNLFAFIEHHNGVAALVNSYSSIANNAGAGKFGDGAAAAQ